MFRLSFVYDAKGLEARKILDNILLIFHQLSEIYGRNLSSCPRMVIEPSSSAKTPEQKAAGCYFRIWTMAT